MSNKISMNVQFGTWRYLASLRRGYRAAFAGWQFSLSLCVKDFSGVSILVLPTLNSALYMICMRGLSYHAKELARLFNGTCRVGRCCAHF
ncbi:hypothetical protein HBI56_137420 [Parastagonospora nodorum]|nr:hypothetical protein HBI59_008650 [Parastagonospora nodorum]KAH6503754.1 hypothetical protein HBI58_019700 [Parastagonospora nodorum]KAH6508998.1 hypothetical protein HBI56_137420 [Parastagonospora nodorum]